MTACSNCGASPEKQHKHEVFGGTKIVLCKVCGYERPES